MMNKVPFSYSCPLGVQRFAQKGRKGLYISYASKSDHCGIVLYDRHTGEEISRHPFFTKNRVGNVYFHTITNIDPQKISYLFFEGIPQMDTDNQTVNMSRQEKLIVDRYAKAYAEEDIFGKAKGAKDYKGILITDTYDWKEDRCPKIPYEDCIVYCMHVRGFTMHASSGVKAKGTFKGITEKIPYLKELGITTLELQPVYEFNELPKEEMTAKIPGAAPLRNKECDKINYWGYKEGFYYAPKRSFAKGKDACKELKDMIKTLHENHMEAVMQFYFPDTVSAPEVLQILRFWHMQYHVDGFHLKGDHLPIQEIAADDYLADCKLWYYDFPVDRIYANMQKPSYRNLAFYNDTYKNCIRRLLKGEEDVLKEAFKVINENSSVNGRIHYLTNYDGFTMMDLFCYERKHNEANGENNQDGTDYNYSANCGAEGSTRSKKILDFRRKQVKNAFAFLMLSQGTPLFFMGDEFGNSQMGNNNPYCQDNEVTWLNWNDLRKNREMYLYVKNLIAFRKEHKVFCSAREYLAMDYLTCGYPDLSYHGTEAWKPSFAPYSRHAGFMLCGEYVKACRGMFYYVAVNMHEESHAFALPKLPPDSHWECILSTDPEKGDQTKEEFLLSPMTIAVFRNLK